MIKFNPRFVKYDKTSFLTQYNSRLIYRKVIKLCIRRVIKKIIPLIYIIIFLQHRWWLNLILFVFLRLLNFSFRWFNVKNRVFIFAMDQVIQIFWNSKWAKGSGLNLVRIAKIEESSTYLSNSKAVKVHIEIKSCSIALFHSNVSTIGYYSKCFINFIQNPL